MGKTHQKSLVKEIVERLDSLMAIGESRGEAKKAAHLAGESMWAFTTGKMHSYKTRQVYQEHAIHFGKWARATYEVKQLADLEARADDLVSAYLRKNLEEQKSAFTLADDPGGAAHALSRSPAGPGRCAPDSSPETNHPIAWAEKAGPELSAEELAGAALRSSMPRACGVMR